MDRLQAIEIFVRVAERRSFSAAADDLNLSRQMVSDRIKDLEQRLGVRLLQRTTRRVSLTESGAAYLEKVRAGIAAIEEAEAEATSLAAHPRGVLRVNAPMSFGFKHVAPAVGDFLLANEDVRVELTLNDRTINLLEENVDVAIRIGRLLDSSLIAKKLATCRMILCASPLYVKAHGAPKHPRDLAHHRCFTFAYWSDGSEWKFTRKGEPASVRIESRLWCNNGEALVEAASVGAGITIQPNFIAGPVIREGRLVELLPAWRMADLSIYAIYPPSQFVPAKTRAFIDHLAKHFAGSPYWEKRLSTEDG
jgi:DNA-binding transcriptional LysR family regulator